MKAKNLVLASGLSIAMGLLAQNSNAETPPPTPAPTGSSHQLSTDSESSIKSTLADVLQNALAGDIEDVVDNFTSDDRKRIDKSPKATYAGLKAEVEHFNASWKAKYNAKFSDGFKSARIPYVVTGAAADKTAAVALPGVATEPAVTVKLVDEGKMTSSWKVDVPDSVTGETMNAALSKAINALEAGKASWPADQGIAYQAVAHRIMSALNGSDK